MSAMKWTAAQEEALSARGGNLLLSAAAGSGKTAVLVERIIRRVTDPDDPVDVNAFLVLTFTRSAAAEMRSRVGAALSERLSEACRAAEAAPTDAHLRRAAYLERQLTLLGSASISTIDAFCQTVLRQYFYLLDIDPNFRVLSDENEKFLLMDDVLSEVLLSWYEKGDPRFLDCADLFSSKYQDQQLRKTVAALYNFTRSLAFPDDFLRHLADPYAPKDARTPDDLPWTADLLASFRDSAAAWTDKYRHISELLDDCDPALFPYRDRISEEFAALSPLAEKEEVSWRAWQAALTADSLFARLPAVKRKDAADPLAFDEVKAEVTRLRDSVKKDVKRLADSYFSIPAGQWIDDLRAARPLVEALSEVTRDFAAAYEARKKKEGLLEFNDMEHLVLRLLLAPESTAERPVPSETAFALRKKFREVMVDEYQDTNDLQELITALLSDGKNRFLVGDIKQSIYRFRQADPGIFLAKYDAYRGGAEGRRIDLNQNFRSDRSVLAAANFLFRQLFRTDAAGRAPLELDYGEAEALHPGRSAAPAPADYAGGAADIELLDLADQSEAEEENGEELDKTELEARMIARRIAALHAAGAKVTEKDGSYRPVRWGDMVILLRAVDRRAPVYLKALREQNIPAVCAQTDDFFSSIEVQLLWALLRVVDNPRQDLAMAAVLRSPFAGLDEESLARLRLRSADSLWEALPQAADVLRSGEALRTLAFLDRYRAWRALSRQTGVAPLIEAILNDTDYLSYVSGLPEGAFRRARVLSFYELARAWDGQCITGLYRFLSYLAQTAASGSPSRLRQAAAPAEEADAVRIMTIHKSKGLEFPVVVLAGTGTAFNRKDTADAALFHKDKGLGLYRFDRERLCRWPTLYWYAVRQANLQESLAEEARLLYVAVTRARDRLIITGTVKDADAAIRGWAQGLRGSASDIPPLPAYRVTGAQRFLDWILPAACRSRSMEAFWERAGLPPAFAAEGGDAAPQFSFSVHTASEYLKPGETADALEEDGDGAAEGSRAAAEAFLHAPACPAPQWVDAQLRWTYPHPGAAAAPAKLTATAAVQLAEADKEEFMPSRVLASPIPEKRPLPPDFAEPPAFLSAAGGGSGAAYGTLMHKAMETLDLARLPADAEALAAAVKDLAAARVFTEDEARLLLTRRSGRRPLDDILAFLESPLGALMRTASVIRKEMPFSLLLPARDFYPDCEAGDTIFLQGAMDCLLENDGALTVIDYKTDRVAEGRLLADHYHRQIQIYGTAAERIFRRPVAALWLWSFHLREAVPVPKRR